MASLVRSSGRTQLLARLIESPELVRSVQKLPLQAFSALVREIGVEDAGELVALATTPQIVAAFDEDLFANDTPGEREAFDPKRFVTWLEVLLEAGSEAAAKRFAELSEDFVARAISSLVLVLDDEALVLRMGESTQETFAAEKALESSLSEQLDGYLLVARIHEGWDAILSLILALDRDHRALLERVLDRCAAASQEYIDDLELLSTVLSEGELLAEDVEAEREERRSAQGYVEPRAAKNFLALAQKPFDAKAPRDPVTKAYFRDLGPAAPPEPIDAGAEKILGLLAQAEGAATRAPIAALGPGPGAVAELDTGARGGDAPKAIVAAMQLLAASAPAIYGERLEELAYLTNVLLSGVAKGGERFRPAEAADAALATVSLGAHLARGERSRNDATAPELAEILREIPVDALFRRASSAITAAKLPTQAPGIACTIQESAELLAKLRATNEKPEKKPQRKR